MAIAIVDDTLFSLEVLKASLRAAGYYDIITLSSAKELYQLVEGQSELGIVELDLILMDIVMPEISGIEACQSIKKRSWLVDVPVIMVTSRTDTNDLQLAFSAGAMDYIKKPLDNVELLARVRSALKLKHETARRKARELELIEVTRQLQAANEKLQSLSFFDGLTGIANRRNFDQRLMQEIKRSRREGMPLSLIMLDIDYFKAFNDTYGHLKGDDCLILVASLLVKALKRPGDFPARYGGEEFAVILPNTDDIGAAVIAEELRTSIERADVEHVNSLCAGRVTVSLGMVTKFPGQEETSEDLIRAADRALYRSKNDGRNRVSEERLHSNPSNCIL